MINIKALFNKGERGTHKAKVKVTRGGKTFYREQMIGQKVPDIVGLNIPSDQIKGKEEMDKNINKLKSLNVKSGDRVDLGNEIGVFKVKKINVDGTITCGEGFGKRYPASLIKKVIKPKNIDNQKGK